LTSTLDLSDGPLKGWKFKVKTASILISKKLSVSKYASQCINPMLKDSLNTQSAKASIFRSK